MSAASHSKRPVALISGIAGFTGQFLARDLLAHGYRVVGLGHNHGMPVEEALPPNAGTATVYRCDLMDRAGLAMLIKQVQPDVVLHLAAIAFVAHGDVDAIYRINVVGTRNLLEALATSGKNLSAVLLASSANIYGNSDVGPIDEAVAPSPVNDYAVSKLAMEHMARLWMDRLPIIIVRPFNYTGVGQAPQFLLPKIVRHFQRGEKIIELGNIDVERDFSDVRRVSQAYCRLVRAAPVGEVFNVCSGATSSLKDVLAIMATIAGYEIEARINPAFVRANEVKCLQGSAQKLERLVGPLPSFSLHETLRWMFLEGKW